MLRKHKYKPNAIRYNNRCLLRYRNRNRKIYYILRVITCNWNPEWTIMRKKKSLTKSHCFNVITKSAFFAVQNILYKPKGRNTKFAKLFYSVQYTFLTSQTAELASKGINKYGTVANNFASCTLAVILNELITKHFEAWPHTHVCTHAVTDTYTHASPYLPRSESNQGTQVSGIFLAGQEKSLRDRSQYWYL